MSELDAANFVPTTMNQIAEKMNASHYTPTLKHFCLNRSKVYEQCTSAGIADPKNWIIKVLNGYPLVCNRYPDYIYAIQKEAFLLHDIFNVTFFGLCSMDDACNFSRFFGLMDVFGGFSLRFFSLCLMDDGFDRFRFKRSFDSVTLEEYENICNLLFL
eukprot:822131_1